MSCFFCGATVASLGVGRDWVVCDRRDCAGFLQGLVNVRW